MIENEKEREARQALEAHLIAGETLLAFTTGNLAGLTTGRPHYVGLTENQLMLLPLKQERTPGQVFSIRREHIRVLKLKWAGFTGHQMEVKLPKDTLRLRISGGHWRERAKDLARLASQTPPASLSSAAAIHQNLVQQAHDFQELGLLGSAQSVLNEALHSDPALSMNPAIEPLRQQIAEARLAFRVGAGFLFAYIGVIAALSSLLVLTGEGLTGFFDFGTIVSVFLALYFGVALWQGKSEQRTSAIGAVILGYVYTVLGALAGGNYLGLITGLSFSGSIILALTGKSNRRRTWLAIAIYVFGYLGVLALSFLVSFVIALLEAVQASGG